MRLPLIVLVAGLTAGCSFLDKTPGEAINDLVGNLFDWIGSLFDAHVTIGDIIVYIIIIIAGFIFLVILVANHTSDIDEETRRRQQDQDDSEMAIKPRDASKAPYRDPWRSYDDSQDP